MTDVITQTRTEDAIARTNEFLGFERGASLDGGYASSQVAERIVTVEERAEAMLTAIPHPNHDGLYVPISKHNSNQFDEAVNTLPGYLVLAPSSLVKPGTNSFYPAVVSEDGQKRGELRLHVLEQPYRQEVGYGASMMLSAAGQSETAGMGEHGHDISDGLEAEHFATLLAAGSDTRVQQAWESGNHINHTWRQQGSSSVTTEVSKRLFGSDAPQSTLTITRDQVQRGQAMLFWHEGMRSADSGQPESATRDKALLLVQSLGFEALRFSNPKGIDDLKRLIA